MSPSISGDFGMGGLASDTGRKCDSLPLSWCVGGISILGLMWHWPQIWSIWLRPYVLRRQASLRLADTLPLSYCLRWSLRDPAAQSLGSFSKDWKKEPSLMPAKIKDAEKYSFSKDLASVWCGLGANDISPSCCFSLEYIFREDANSFPGMYFSLSDLWLVQTLVMMPGMGIFLPCCPSIPPPDSGIMEDLEKWSLESYMSCDIALYLEL